MASPILRGCCRFSSAFTFTRLFLLKNSHPNGCAKMRLPPSPAAGTAAVALRHYSSERRQKQSGAVIVGFPNPFIWFRTRIYFFLIRTYFDTDFSIKEFTEGAKQGFSHVSGLLSKCQFEALEGLVAKDVIEQFEAKCNLLPSNYKKALSADPDEIVDTTTRDVGIYYDDNGRKFVSILMRFCYLKSACLPEEKMVGAQTIPMLNAEGEIEPKMLLMANYEFQREFTKGVPPDWTITRIEHCKILD